MDNRGKTAVIACEGSFVDNQGDKIVFDSTYEKKPVSFVVGAGMVIAGVDEAVAGMEVGQKISIVIPPEKAFGPYDKDKLETFPLSALSEQNGGKPVEVGQFLSFTDSQGNRGAGQILRITDAEFVFDFNHPFAGKTVNYDIELLSLS